jgi:hypothetical protein|tara:strand:- start:4917 stop:5294 length:378 start_codon:yes stop_codon:yes gene_type:complete
MLDDLPFDINEYITNILPDKDLMNIYNLNKYHKKSYKKHASALKLKQHLNLHKFENTTDFCYIVGFYSSFNLIKFLQYVFDTPSSDYIYDPFTSDVTRRKNPDLKWTHVISRRNKTLDGLLDLFY